MKKVYPILLVGIIVFGGFGTVGISNDNSLLIINNEPSPELNVDGYVGFGIGLFEDIPVVQVHVGCDKEKYYSTDMNARILFNLVILR